MQPGNARAKECLEDNREKEGFSKPCKDELEKMMAARAADFRLDPKLRQLCARDIQVPLHHMLCCRTREDLNWNSHNSVSFVQTLHFSLARASVTRVHDNIGMDAVVHKAVLRKPCEGASH